MVLKANFLRARAKSDMDSVIHSGLRPPPIVKIIVRFRPLLKEEVSKGDVHCVSCRGGKVKLKPPKHLSLGRGVREFEVDRAIASTCGEGEVFDATTSRLVTGNLQGRDGLVVLAGTPSSGRKYTLWGTSSAPGILRSALTTLLRKSCDGASFRLCMAEVQGDNARDLLHEGPEGEDWESARSELPSVGGNA
ncbi:unnamed protein product, partial [Discosporangium mesarthrocarpum]